MNLKKFLLALICLATFTVSNGFARQDSEPQSPSDSDSDLMAIEGISERLRSAFEARDLESIMLELSPDVVITWQNGDRVQGPDEFQTFFNSTLVGEKSLIEELTQTSSSDPTIRRHGDSTAVAYGSIEEQFKLRDGHEFKLESQWTATLVKKDQQWKVASYHVSANILNNPMLNTARSYLMTFASVAAIFGFGMGALIAWFIMKSTRQLTDKL